MACLAKITSSKPTKQASHFLVHSFIRSGGWMGQPSRLALGCLAMDLNNS